MKKLITALVASGVLVLGIALPAEAKTASSAQGDSITSASYVIGEYPDSTNTYTITNNYGMARAYKLEIIRDGVLQPYEYTGLVAAGESITYDSPRTASETVKVWINDGVPRTTSVASVSASPYDVYSSGKYIDIRTGELVPYGKVK